MKNIKRLALMACLCLLAALSLGIVLFAASACQNKQGEPLTGAYYADVDGTEYTVEFDGDAFTFTFSVAGDERSGTYYTEDGVAVTLTFSDAEEELAARLDGGKLTFTYKDTAYEMIEKVTYTVTFDLDGGTGTGSAQVVNGKLLAEPADPQKDGMVFVGWYKDSAFTESFDFAEEKITGNITLYARYAESAEGEFTLSFDAGDYEGALPEAVQTAGGKLYLTMLPDLPAQDGNEFLGWWYSHENDAEKLTAMVTDGQDVKENLTLFAVWESDAPAVSVTAEGVSWLSMGVNVSYTVTITAPDGAATSVNEQITNALSQAFDFASAAEGEYTVAVTANGQTATAYYTNKALARVSLFTVDGFDLTFNAIEDAEYYLVSYTCGTPGHTHASVRVNVPALDFSDCDMLAEGMRFTVEAVADGYVTSVSAPFVFERHLADVTGLTVTDDGKETYAAWDATENAASYVVKVTDASGTEEFTVTGTKFDLQSFYGALTVEVTPKTFGYNSPAAAEQTYEKARLATPENIRTDSDAIVWNPVEEATGYTVFIGDRSFTVKTNKWTPTDEDLAEVGSDFSVGVQAIAADAANSSFAAQTIVSRELGNIVYNSGRLSWNPVLGVARYGVRVNGGDVTPVEDATSAAVTLTQAGNNVLSVCYYIGDEPGEWVDITVDANVTVTLDNNAGAAATERETYYVAGDPVILSSEERLGYTFLGWYTAASGGQPVSDTVSATADVTYYAQWSANTYTVTLTVENSEGYFEEGTEQVNTVQVEVTFDSPFTFPVPFSADGTRAFYGWYSEFGGVGTQFTDPEGESVMVWNQTADRTLHVRWVEAFTYTLIANPNDYSQSAYSVSKGPGIQYLTRVTVPAVYNGLPVTTIEGSCFERCTNLVTVNIPDSIHTVFTGDEGSNSTGSAFYRCTSLREIVVYDASDYFTGQYEKRYFSADGMLIYNNEFGGVELSYVPMGITGEITVPDTVTSIPLNAFAGTYVTAINVPASVTTIGEHAFNNYRIVEVNFLPAPEGTEEKPLTIGSEAFLNSNIEEITLPARLQSFDVSIFDSCDDLQKVHITQSDTSVYSSVDGVVFTDGGKTLYFCPSGRSGNYTVASTVVTIGERAFYECADLTGIIIPGNVELIGKEAFYGCRGLRFITFQGKAKDPALTIEESAFYYSGSRITELSLPENLKVLGANAFGNISGLTKVIVNTAITDIEYSNGAFASTSGTTTVKTLVLGPNVALFDINGVFGSASLTSVEVDAANPNFEAQDGVLFNKDMTRIVYYPTGRPGGYVLPETVEEIGANVFYDNDNLTAITFGAKISEIGESAFEGCDALTSITFTSGEGGTLAIGKKAFYDCMFLVSVTLPTGKDAITIGDEAFSYCRRLSEINFPEGVTSIGHAAFNNCNGLTDVALPASLVSLATYASDYDYDSIYSPEYFTDPGVVAEAGTDNIDVFNFCSTLANITVAEGNSRYAAIDNVLYGKNAETGAIDVLYFSPIDNNVANIVIPKTVVEIKDRAFYYNENIISVSFEERDASTPLTFGQMMFYLATSLESVTLPSGLTEITDRMFNGASLKSIFIPNTVTYIGEGAFYACSDLTEVIFEEGGTAPLVLADGTDENVSSGTGQPNYVYYGVFAGCTNLTEIVLPERTTEIGDYAFFKSSGTSTYPVGSGIVSAVIPSTVTRIGEYAFAVGSLEDVTFASGTSSAMTIERYAFYGSDITELTLSGAVQSIGDYAFSRNDDLTTVNFAAGITSIGTSAFSSNDSLAQINFAEGCKLATIGGSAFLSAAALTSANLENCTVLTEIGASAFKGTGLTAVKLPASIVTVGNNAFENCTALTSVEFLTADVEGAAKSSLQSVGNLAFARTALTEMSFPDSTANITLGDYLFSACSQLTTVRVSSSIVEIGSAFSQCLSLRTIIVEAGNQNYYGHPTDPLLLNVDGTRIVLAFGPVTEEGDTGEYRLPDGLTVVGESAFAGQNGIKKLYIPATVTTIEDNAFEYCRSLEEVVFDEGSLLTEIGDYAFAECHSLKSINLPEGLQKMGMYAFTQCISLKEAILPSTLLNIGNYAFRNCSSLEAVNIPKLASATGYTGTYMFDNCVSLKNVTFSAAIDWLPNYMFRNCTALESVTFPAEITELTGAQKLFQDSGLKSADLGGITAIPQYMFYESTQLTDVDLGDVVSIGNYAFQYCESLKNVDLSNVETIGNYAFGNCAALTEADLSSVASLGTYAFQNDTALKRVILSDSLGTIGNYAFNGCTSLTTVAIAHLALDEVEETEGEALLPSALSSLGNYAFQGTAIRKVTIPRGVTRLYYSTSSSTPTASSTSYTFRNCTQLEEVVLHDALTMIGGYSFTNCGKLKTVRYLNASGELVGNEGELTLPESLTILGNYAFGSGRGSGSSLDEGEAAPLFTKAIIPESVERMGSYSFQDCVNLKEVHYLTSASTYSTSATGYATYMFDGCTNLEKIVLNQEITSFGNYTFRNCSSLTTIDLYDPIKGEVTEGVTGVAKLPDMLEYIGTYCFQNTGFTEIFIPRGVTKLSSAVSSTTTGSAALSNNAKLEKVVLHDALTMLGSDVFMNCPNLKTVQYTTSDGALNGEENVVTLPYGLQLIGDNAFTESGVEKVIIPETVTRVGAEAFSNCLSLKEVQYLTSSTRYSTSKTSYTDSVFLGCTALEKIVLNAEIECLPEDIFLGCTALTTIQLYDPATKAVSGNEGEALLPTSLETIEAGVFEDCESISVMILPSTLKTIGNGVFNGAKALTALELPEGLEEIGADAFLNTGLTAITVPSTVTSIGNNAFNKLSVTVAEGNTAFMAQDGVLLNADAEAIGVPGAMSGIGNYTVPAGVKIGAYALNGFRDMTVTLTTDQIVGYAFSYFYGNVIVTLGESKSIPDRAFQNYMGTSVVLPEGLEEIGDHAFYRAANIRTVAIPETVQTIGNQIFRECTSLQSVAIPEGVEKLGGYTFNSCASLVSVTLPSTLKTLGNYEFSGCTALESIVLPKGLQKFGTYLFQNCTSLKKVTFQSLQETSSLSSSSKPFSGCTALEEVIFEEGVTIIPTYMFHQTPFTKIDLPSTITTIGGSAFRESNIKSIVLPASVTSLGTYTFADNTALETVYIPESLTTIGNYAFQNCTSLKTIYLYRLNAEGEMEIVNSFGEGVADLTCVTSIGDSAFIGCTSLAGVEFADNIEELKDTAFSGSGLKSVTIPGSIGILCEEMFQNCIYLESVIVEEGVTEIELEAFMGCTSLKSVSLPSTLVEVGNYCFSGCTALQKLELPVGLSTLDVTPFVDWTAAQTLVVYVYVLDSGCNWNVNWAGSCRAKIEFVVLYSYGGDEETAA